MAAAEKVRHHSGDLVFYLFVTVGLGILCVTDGLPVDEEVNGVSCLGCVCVTELIFVLYTVLALVFFFSVSCPTCVLYAQTAGRFLFFVCLCLLSKLNLPESVYSVFVLIV